MRNNVKCKSGLRGWQGRLKEVYKNFDEFEAWCETHGIHVRLGFGDMRQCWLKNPVVQGSVNPADLRRVRPKRTCKKCGSKLAKGFCTDLACPYSDHRQNQYIRYG